MEAGIALWLIVAVACAGLVVVGGLGALLVYLLTRRPGGDDGEG
jgi:hypothetical protein